MGFTRLRDDGIVAYETPAGTLTFQSEEYAGLTHTLVPSAAAMKLSFREPGTDIVRQYDLIRR